jgi:hypothetical protein
MGLYSLTLQRTGSPRSTRRPVRVWRFVRDRRRQARARAEARSEILSISFWKLPREISPSLSPPAYSCCEEFCTRRRRRRRSGLEILLGFFFSGKWKCREQWEAGGRRRWQEVMVQRACERGVKWW